jgi:hypothetical protein
MLAWWTPRTAADTDKVGSKHIKHVLLLSIDGMHAVDFHNCARGIAGANGGEPYCPNMAGLSRTGINYVGAASSSPQTLSPASPRSSPAPHRSQPGLTMTCRMTGHSMGQLAPVLAWRRRLDPRALEAVRIEGTAVLPEVAAQLAQ